MLQSCEILVDMSHRTESKSEMEPPALDWTDAWRAWICIFAWTNMGVSRRKTTRNDNRVLQNETHLWRSLLLKKKDYLNAENQAIDTYRIWKVSDNCCCWPRVCLSSVCGQPRRRSLGKPKLPSLVFGTGILPHLQIDSLLLSTTAQFFGIDPRSFLLETHGRAASNQKCQRGTSLRVRCVRVGLCRPSLPSRCNYVSACRKAVFLPLPVRRVPGWPQNLRGVVRQTGRQQGRESGRVRAESWPGCDGHQVWERSSPGRLTEGGGGV